MEQRDGDQSETLKLFKEGNSVFWSSPARLLGSCGRGGAFFRIDACGGFPDLLVVVERVFHKTGSDDVAFVHIIKKSLRLFVRFLNWL
jgi:hypothetical protein